MKKFNCNEEFASEALQYDCCTQRTLFFENAFYALLDEFRKHKIDSIINKYANVDVLGFAEFLVSNNFASLVNDISLFPTLKKVWFSPNEMENAIIDIDSTSNHNYKKISEELQALHCAHLEIRIFYDADIQKLSNIARHFYKADFKSVDIIVKYKEEINPPVISNLLPNTHRCQYLSMRLHQTLIIRVSSTQLIMASALFVI